MHNVAIVTTNLMKWAYRSKSVDNDQDCGDKCIVTEVPDGVLIAVIDGVGHGAKASMASEQAISVIEANKNDSIASIVELCHDELGQTRGAVLSIAVVKDEGVMHWVGVGNVEGRLIRKEGLKSTATGYGSLLLRTGTLGRGSLPTLVPLSLPLTRYDTLVLVTDGIDTDFEDAIRLEQDPDRIAQNIMTNYRKSDDDALVFVGKYLG